ncbi:MAG: tRNA dihydrouridine(16) synthase DusC [Enterobacteriaceae bacterium]
MLAPMEGVLDSLMRHLLTEINDYTFCVTEFVRVTNTLLPERFFYRLCPELMQQGATESGTPVRVQLLGDSPHWLAENAWRAVQLGARGIDLNCGCPSKTVNGSNGGASLLKQPQLITRCAQAIRQAVPGDIPVTVKVRLGWECASYCLEIADAVQQAGVDAIVVHGRSKTDGYRADRINWPAIGEIRQRLTIPVIANGEITSRESAQQCMALTGCRQLMLGRGALIIPNLARVIQGHEDAYSWAQVLQLLQRYIAMDKPGDSGLYHVARIKQWLGLLRSGYTQANVLFGQIRVLKERDSIARLLDRERVNFS